MTMHDTYGIFEGEPTTSPTWSAGSHNATARPLAWAAR